MREAITDTGPVLHLSEIERLESLRVFEHLVVPDLVAEELRAHGLDPSHLDVMALKVTIVIVERTEWSLVLSEADQPTIHPADAQVFILARSSQFQKPVLTDDLALRRRLESQGATAVGSVGVLVRAYTTGHLKRDELEKAFGCSSPCATGGRPAITTLAHLARTPSHLSQKVSCCWKRSAWRGSASRGMGRRRKQ